jgi:hypothetical protein
MGFLVRYIHDRAKASESLVTGVAMRGMIRHAPLDTQQRIAGIVGDGLVKSMSALASQDKVMFGMGGRAFSGKHACAHLT